MKNVEEEKVTILRSEYERLKEASVLLCYLEQLGIDQSEAYVLAKKATETFLKVMNNQESLGKNKIGE
jgi:hypothetical protein